MFNETKIIFLSGFYTAVNKIFCEKYQVKKEH